MIRNAAAATTRVLRGSCDVGGEKIFKIMLLQRYTIKKLIYK